jgi:hypothetical protein
LKTTYIITFDISDKSRLSKLKKYLKENKIGVCPIHENAWAIRDTKKSSEIRDELMEMTVPEDRLFVIRTGTEASWKNIYGEKNGNWLKKYL